MKKVFPVTVPELEGRYADLKGVPLRDASVPNELLTTMLKWRKPLYVTEAAIVLKEREEARKAEVIQTTPFPQQMKVPTFTAVPSDLWDRVVEYAKTQQVPF
jgi:hypothetical protein